MSETWRRLITNFVANLLSSSTPTHSHDFGNHSNGYDHSNIVVVRSVIGSPEICFFDSMKLENNFRIGEDYNF
jgi:hypothetical protein